MNLTTATPVEIDTRLFAIMREQDVLRASLDHIVYGIHRAANDEQYTERNGSRYVTRWEKDFVTALEIAKGIAKSTLAPAWEITRAQDALAAWEDYQSKAKALRDEADTLNAEFTRRGGWTRAFLAVTSKGHIHSSMECSTCYDSTQYFWFTDLSGHDEAEIVTKAGSDACTVCYPSAPVNDLKRPRSIFTDDEQAAQKARDERAAAKAARDAATVTFQWTEYGRTTQKTFKTLRAATNALAGALNSLCWFGVEHPSATEWLANVEAGREALGDAWDYEKALTAARKKSVKEAGEYLHQKVTGFDPETRSYVTEWSDAPLYPKF